MRFAKSAAVLARRWRWRVGSHEPRDTATPLRPEGACGHAPWPGIGTKVVDANGVEWVVQAVVYDEAGPERVFVASADQPAATGARACSVALVDWCRFCAGEQVHPRAG